MTSKLILPNLWLLVIILAKIRQKSNCSKYKYILSSDGWAVCSTILQVMDSSPILAWNFFNKVSLNNCISYSFPCNWSLKHHSHYFLSQPSLLSIRSSVVVFSGLAFIKLKALKAEIFRWRTRWEPKKNDHSLFLNLTRSYHLKGLRREVWEKVVKELDNILLIDNHSLKSRWIVPLTMVPLFTQIENNDCFSIYTRSDLDNTRSQHLQKKTIQMTSWTPSLTTVNDT